LTKQDNNNKKFDFVNFKIHADCEV